MMPDFNSWGDTSLKKYIHFSADRKKERPRSTNCKHDTLVLQALQIHEKDPVLLQQFLHIFRNTQQAGANARLRGPGAVDTVRSVQSTHHPPPVHAQTSAPTHTPAPERTLFRRESSISQSPPQGYFPASDPADLNLTTTTSASSDPPHHHQWGHQATINRTATPPHGPPPAVHAPPAASAFDLDPHHGSQLPRTVPPGRGVPHLQERTSVPPHQATATATAPAPSYRPSSRPPHLSLPSQLPQTPAAGVPVGAAQGHYPPNRPAQGSISSAPPSSPSTSPSIDNLSPRTTSSGGAGAQGYLPAAVAAQPPLRPVYPSPHAPYEDPRYPPGAAHPPPATGRSQKRALLIGCCYPNSPDVVRGACHDVERMRHLLCSRFRFDYNDVQVLMDEATPSAPRVHPDTLPTRANIVRKMQELVRDAQPGDSLFFHFSGHGLQIPDTSANPEPDGMNEMLCPTDWRTAGPIVDDRINEYLIGPLPPGVRLHALVDACHSGTSMDLPFSFQYDHASGTAPMRPGDCRPKGTSGGFAAMFSGCDDSELAADTVSLGHPYHSGVATSCFVEACEQILDSGQEPTYIAVLAGMSQRVRAYEKSRSARERDRRKFAPVQAVDAVLSGQGIAAGFAQLFRRSESQQETSQTPQLSVSSIGVPASCTANVDGAFLHHVMRI